MEKEENKYMRKAINEAKKAYDKDEIPIGVILVKDHKILSKAYNERDSKNIVTKHAEIIAIEKANRKLNNWRLVDVIMYTTLEPCKMCSEVIKEAKIKKVIYGAKKLNSEEELGFTQVDDKSIINECELLIKRKFSEIRKK